MLHSGWWLLNDDRRWASGEKNWQKCEACGEDAGISAGHDLDSTATTLTLQPAGRVCRPARDFVALLG
jgi:hypothetical protein